MVVIDLIFGLSSGILPYQTAGFILHEFFGIRVPAAANIGFNVLIR
jgi:hypothetical protein